MKNIVILPFNSTNHTANTHYRVSGKRPQQFTQSKLDYSLIAKGWTAGYLFPETTLSFAELLKEYFSFVVGRERPDSVHSVNTYISQEELCYQPPTPKVIKISLVGTFEFKFQGALWVVYLACSHGLHIGTTEDYFDDGFYSIDIAISGTTDPFTLHLLHHLEAFCISSRLERDYKGLKGPDAIEKSGIPLTVIDPIPVHPLNK